MAKNAHRDDRSSTCRIGEKAVDKGTYVKRDGAVGSISASGDARSYKGATKEADRTAKRKAMTLRVFNDIHDSHQKAR